MATDWAAAVAKMRALVQVYLDALAKGPLNAHQAASLAIDLKTLDVDLAGLHAQLTAPAAPALTPTNGLTNWGAAQIDAGFVFQASRGNTVGADTNPAPGAAKALGFSGVVADSASGLYGTFVDGVLTETGGNPGAGPGGFTMRFGLAAGINPDDPYTGPGAVRP